MKTRARAPQRYRTRLLVAMLMVAVLPLLTFAALVVVDLGSISKSTVDQANSSLLESVQQRQLGDVGDQAQLVDQRLSGIAGQLAAVRGQLLPRLDAVPATSVVPDSLTTYRGISYSGDASSASTILIGETPSGQTPSPAPLRGAAVVLSTEPLIPQLQHLEVNFPEIQAVWVASTASDSVITVPGFDVPEAVAAGRVAPNTPLGPDGASIFSTSQRAFEDTGGGSSQVWSQPGQPIRPNTQGPYWTDPYPTRLSGNEGVTVWIPVSGTTLVGADVSIGQVTRQVLNTSTSGEPGAYPLLLSSTNRILAAGSPVTTDFPHSADTVGSSLPISESSSFGSAITDDEQLGHADIISATLGGVAKQTFTAPIYSAHWILATVVPAADLEPNLSALTRGIDSGITGLLLDAVPVVLLLCLLAFALARLLARRLVEPVHALTHAAERLGKGNTEEPVPPQGTDEVGVLAAALERMRREINLSRDAIMSAAHELETRVADRTTELRARNEELTALNELAASLSRSLDPELILAGALGAIRAVLPVQAGSGFLLSDGRLCSAGDALPQQSSDDAALLAEAAEHCVTSGETATLVRTGIQAVALPVAGRDHLLGALAVIVPASCDLGPTSPLLGAVADQVALALRTAQLSAEGRVAAVLEERTRLAREIHDTLAQQLTGIVIQLETADAFVGGGAADQRAHAAVAQARDLARAALQEARRSVWDLRPQPLAATGLAAAIAGELDRWSARTGIGVHLRSESLPRPLALQPTVEVALLRITQEALSNIVKHAQADHVEVTLSATDGSLLTLAVHDNGVGFDPTASRRGDAFGVTGMRERALLAGGLFSLESTPGGGTTLSVRVSLGDVGDPERLGSALVNA